MPVSEVAGGRSHPGHRFYTMADTPQKNNDQNKKVDLPKEGDPLFTLHHAQAEAALSDKNIDVDSSTNQYMTEEQQENVDEAMAPRDSQGFTRGQEEPGVIGSNAGGHK